MVRSRHLEGEVEAESRRREAVAVEAESRRRRAVAVAAESRRRQAVAVAAESRTAVDLTLLFVSPQTGLA